MAGRGRLRKNFMQEKIGQARNKNGLPKGRGGITKGDARLKIIQKNRSKLVDARDRLAQMAKKMDARDKIMKLRQTRQGGGSMNGQNVRSVGNSILMTTDRNGKISLSTNKMKRLPAPTDINAAIKKELGLIRAPRKMVPSNPVQHVNNPPSYRKSYPVPERYPKSIEMNEVYPIPPPNIKRTIHNDMLREMPPLPDFSHKRAVHPGLYSWILPSSSRHSMPTQLPSIDHKQTVKVTARNNLVDEQDWNYADPNVRSIKMASSYIEIDEDEDEYVSPRPMKTNVHSRLDTPSSVPGSQGIFAQVKPKVIVPVGHRIVVSNLQPTVTQDDIRELFEDVGELLVSRLVRPGTAEVIYKNLKDAQKAVDTYHNRQLDGQPMKCLLVNKRPLNNPTAPAVRSAKATTSVLRTSGGITKKNVSSLKLYSTLIPDISTIHKVLFHKS